MELENEGLSLRLVGRTRSNAQNLRDRKVALVERNYMLIVEEEGSRSARSLAVEADEKRSDQSMAAADLVRWDMIADDCLYELGHDQRKLRLRGLFHWLHPQEEASFPYAQ